MKRIISTIGIILSVIFIQAQTDIIYPAKGKAIIRKCEITDVKNGNMVYYTKDSISEVVEAVAINKDGNYSKLSIEKTTNNISPFQPGLYKGHDYDYYGRLYSGALTKRNIGIGLTFFGVSISLVGALLPINTYGSSTTAKAAKILFYGGALMADVGAVLWISGAIKASNNKNAMEMTKKSVNLSLCTTNNVVGLVLTF